MRTPLIAGNWKMFKTVSESVAFAKEFKRLVKDITGMDIVLAPPLTALHAVVEAVRASNIAVASQNLYYEKEGAFTGEVSAAMVREAGAEYAIVGHSERRRMFGDTDVVVNRKVRAAIAAGLEPIMCVGETLEEREGNATLAVLDRQLKDGLDSITPEQMKELVIAYEPVWAIGTGRTASSAQAQDAHAHIRGRLRQWYGAAVAEKCRILYGGSVKADNVAELIAQPDVDGGLVGGASLDVRGFGDIVARARQAVV